MLSHLSRWRFRNGGLTDLMVRSKQRARKSRELPVPVSGVRLAFDVGTVRIGVARCDERGMLALPLDSIPAGVGAIPAIVRLVSDWEVTGILVGLPLMMDGSSGLAAVSARAWAAEVATAVAVPIQLVDERLSTIAAQRALHDAGRNVRSSRALIDSASAVILLQSYLDSVGSALGYTQGEVLK